MDVRQLRHFLAVAETLNYARAAERLMMAASPLSRSIQQLEVEVGGALFIRGTRKVELTPLGMALIPHAERTVADLDTLTREMHRKVSGHPDIHIGMRSLPSELLRMVIDDVVRAVEPESDVRVHPMDSFAQVDQLLAGRLSFGLLNRRVDDRRLDYLTVLRERVAIALPDQPKYRQLTEVRPQDISGLRLLLQPGTSSTSSPMDDYLLAAAEVEHIGFEIVGGIAAIVADGESCCFTIANPDAPWHRYLQSEGVVIRPVPEAFPQGETYLAWLVHRDRDGDLGPVLNAARTRFETPLER
jgi:DNA-binding transcriptional LysR family regulator